MGKAKTNKLSQSAKEKKLLEKPLPLTEDDIERLVRVNAGSKLTYLDFLDREYKFKWCLHNSKPVLSIVDKDGDQRYPPKKDMDDINNGKKLFCVNIVMPPSICGSYNLMPERWPTEPGKLLEGKQDVTVETIKKYSRKYAHWYTSKAEEFMDQYYRAAVTDFVEFLCDPDTMETFSIYKKSVRDDSKLEGEWYSTLSDDEKALESTDPVKFDKLFNSAYRTMIEETIGDTNKSTLTPMCNISPTKEDFSYRLKWKRSGLLKPRSSTKWITKKADDMMNELEDELSDDEYAKAKVLHSSGEYFNPSHGILGAEDHMIRLYDKHIGSEDKYLGDLIHNPRSLLKGQWKKAVQSVCQEAWDNKNKRDCNAYDLQCRLVPLKFGGGLMTLPGYNMLSWNFLGCVEVMITGLVIAKKGGSAKYFVGNFGTNAPILVLSNDKKETMNTITSDASGYDKFLNMAGDDDDDMDVDDASGSSPIKGTKRKSRDTSESDAKHAKGEPSKEEDLQTVVENSDLDDDDVDTEPQDDETERNDEPQDETADEEDEIRAPGRRSRHHNK